jgi:ABC-2 type transport system ATP-binding protein
MTSIIEVQNFTKRYGKFTAVDDISFNVEEGSIFAFLGPNGAGKSTTINTLCTIFDKTEGVMRIDGKDVTKQKDQVRRVIGVVFQESTLDTKMTLEENLRMHCHFYSIDRREIPARIDFALEIVELTDWKQKMVGALSGGMKRRVEIARSLLHNPKVLFLDEPTTGLDPQTRAHMWDYIVKLQKENNMTIFLTTHYMEEAEISHQVAVIDGGHIVAMDTPYELKKRYTKDHAYITTAAAEELESLLQEYQMEYKRKPTHFAVVVQDMEALLELVARHREHISDMEIKKGTLNDVFLEITGKDIRS